jgi:hypothetical protein
MRKFNASMGEFGRELLKQDTLLEKNAHADQIQTVLQGRGLKL